MNSQALTLNILQVFYGGDRKLTGQGERVTVGRLKDILRLHFEPCLSYFCIMKTLKQAMNT